MEKTTDKSERGKLLLREDQSLVKGHDLTREINTLLAIDFMSIAELPESHKKIAELRWGLDARLYLDFQSTLSPDEREVIKANVEGFIPQPLYSKWDHHIQDAAQQYGARLLLCNAVMARVWAWASGESDGIYRLESLFRSIVNSARIGQGKAKGTITNRHRRAKKPFVAQLAELQKRVRDEWPESPEAVRKSVVTLIENSPQFVHLKTNKQSSRLASTGRRCESGKMSVMAMLQQPR